jgi:site-specific recombinase XerD
LSRVRKVSQKVDSGWEKCLEHFLLFKKSQGLAERTLNDYHYHVSQFFQNSRLSSMGNYEALRLAVMNYFAESSNLSPSTFNMRRKTLKVFFNWAMDEGIISDHPLDGIKKRKEDEKPRSVKEDQIKSLLSSLKLNTYVGVRDYALILLTMDTGIRPSEAFGLIIGDFNFKALEVNIPPSVAKTRVSRTLPLTAITVDAIRKLIMARHSDWKETIPLFCTEDGQPMNRFVWDKRLNYYSQQIGVKIRPYDLRHSFAVMFLRYGGNAFSLQRTLGHTNLSMTKRYVSLTENDLHQQHSIATPINRLVSKKHRVRKV